MSHLSPAGVMDTTVSRCHNPRVHLQPMTLLCQNGSATHHAINIGGHSYWRIPLESNATRTASRSGPILEMAIFAAPLEMIMVEEPDMLSIASHVVKAMLLIMAIQVNTIQN